MKKHPLDRLFERARAEIAPGAPPDFAAAVQRAAAREPAARRAEALAILEPLNRWFPTVAAATAAVMLACAAADYGLTAAGLPGLDDSLAQMASPIFSEGEGM